METPEDFKVKCEEGLLEEQDQRMETAEAMSADPNIKSEDTLLESKVPPTELVAHPESSSSRSQSPSTFKAIEGVLKGEGIVSDYTAEPAPAASWTEAPLDRIIKRESPAAAEQLAAASSVPPALPTAGVCSPSASAANALSLDDESLHSDCHAEIRRLRAQVSTLSRDAGQKNAVRAQNEALLQELSRSESEAHRLRAQNAALLKENSDLRAGRGQVETSLMRSLLTESRKIPYMKDTPGGIRSGLVALTALFNDDPGSFPSGTWLEQAKRICILRLRAGTGFREWLDKALFGLESSSFAWSDLLVRTLQAQEQGVFPSSVQLAGNGAQPAAERQRPAAVALPPCPVSSIQISPAAADSVSHPARTSTTGACGHPDDVGRSSGVR